MALKARITDDMKAAMKARESARLAAIRLLLAAVKQKEIDDRGELDDAGVVSVLDRLIKQRKDSIAQFEQAGRTDLAAQERAELAVLSAYLPQRLDADAIGREIQAIVAELGAKGPGDMGRVMAVAKTRLGSQAEMSAVSAAVKQALAAG